MKITKSINNSIGNIYSNGTKIILTSIIAALACGGIIHAATTIGANISTGGTITATSLTTTGNIGIGTSSPYAKLSVVGEAAASYFTATSTTATSTFPYMTSSQMALTGLTAGSIPFVGAGGILIQDNSNLYWDNANNRLGLGDATPDSYIDILGSGISTLDAISIDFTQTGDEIYPSLRGVSSILKMQHNNSVIAPSATGFSNIIQVTGAPEDPDMRGIETRLELSSNAAGTSDGGAWEGYYALFSQLGSRNYTLQRITQFHSQVADGNSGIVSADYFRHIFLESVPNFGGTIGEVTGVWIDKQANGTANYGIVIDGDGAGADLVLGDAQGSKIYESSDDLYLDTIDDIIIGTSTLNNVGIGTSTPAVKLEVNGLIKTHQTASTTCAGSVVGSIFYNTANDSFWGCKSTGWQKLDN